MSGKQGEIHISLDIEVLEVEGVLPHVDPEDGDQIQERVLIGGSRNLQTLFDRIQPLKKGIKIGSSPTIRRTYEPAPARTLDGRCGGGELFLELINRNKVLFKGSPKDTSLQDSAVATFGIRLGQVLPEQGMVDVTWGAMKADQ